MTSECQNDPEENSKIQFESRILLGELMRVIEESEYGPVTRLCAASALPGLILAAYAENENHLEEGVQIAKDSVTTNALRGYRGLHELNGAR